MRRLRAFLGRLVYGITHPEEEVTRLQRVIRDGYILIRHGYRRLAQNRAPQMAAALSYRTLFSLVPLMAMSLIVLKGFYGTDGMKDGLDRFLDFIGISEIQFTSGEFDRAEAQAVDEEASGPFPPADGGAAEGEPQAQAVAVWLEQFVENAVDRIASINFTLITVVSAGIFLYAALSLLFQIEDSFNIVCEAPRGRRRMVRLTTYWTLMTLGTVILFISFIVGDQMRHALESLPGWATWFERPVTIATQVGAVWLVLLFAYTQMPNTRVYLAPAAIGAIISALLWTAARAGLGLYVDSLTAGQIAVYGTMALLPLFLLWVYVTWLVILFGLEVTYAFQTRPTSLDELRTTSEPSSTVDQIVPIALLHVVADHFARGETAELRSVADKLALPEHAVAGVARRLIDAGFLHKASKDKAPTAYMLARPADSIALVDVIRAAMPLGARPRIEGASRAVDEDLMSLRRAQVDVLEGRTLASIGVGNGII